MRHSQFADEQSDFFSYLKLWDFYHDLKERLSKSKLRRACAQNFLSFNRLREWTEIHRQLLQLVASKGSTCHPRQDDYDRVHQSLLTGFLSGVAYLSAEHEYSGAGGVKFNLWPGSALFRRKPKWCLVEELIETRRRYGRTAAKIQPNWIEPLADHVVKRRYDDPHWHRQSGRVMAWESVTLFGLPIVTRRRIPYGPLEPEIASEIFVRDGLAKRDLDCHDRFYRDNEQTIDECAKLAAKTRRAEWIVDEYTLYQFYNSRLPVAVYDLASLRQWLKASPEHRDQLKMRVADLVDAGSAELRDQFPDEVSVGPLTLPVQYEFQPGEEHDGITLTIPAEGLGQVDVGQAEWVVPGLLEEKIVALIRSLPKAIRPG